MTLLNAWRNADAGWMATDSAYLDGSGKVLAFGAKVFPISDWPSVAAAATFGCDPIPLIRYMQGAGAVDADDVQAMLPEACEHYLKASRKKFPDHPARIRLVALVWCKELGEPRIFVCQRGAGLMPGPSGAYETDHVITVNGRMPGRVLDKIKRQDPLDTQADLIPLIEAQRAEPFKGEGYRAIGGEVHLVRVGADGVTGETIHTWPDKIGEQIGAQLDYSGVGGVSVSGDM